MTQPTIEARVAKILADQFGKLDPATVTPELNLREDLRADSLDGVEIAMALEEEFGVQITDDECEACTTVGELQQLLVKLTGGAA
ncbi:acyl carrier protein [Blastomonas sp. CCH5-A3]|jgi:acyl carrier protein|uniref:acyl carrier protein n=1 Tax=Blastomonas sp. CCH5-A3 TaxID=1768761 RepID=UPI00082601B2|nr:acyl carrier protein [Blastomonas sp. CCH5-A3]MAF60239.1 acyl carrier protein [Blastomonas sp.]|tara:strand:- start:102645 stop:102899 length:255 start_codon:yes stop_codon:yes gene_type:complete